MEEKRRALPARRGSGEHDRRDREDSHQVRGEVPDHDGARHRTLCHTERLRLEATSPRFLGCSTRAGELAVVSRISDGLIMRRQFGTPSGRFLYCLKRDRTSWRDISSHGVRMYRVCGPLRYASAIDRPRFQTETQNHPGSHPGRGGSLPRRYI